MWGIADFKDGLTLAKFQCRTKTSVEFVQPPIHSLTDSGSLLWAYVERPHPAANL